MITNKVSLTRRNPDGSLTLLVEESDAGFAPPEPVEHDAGVPLLPVTLDAPVLVRWDCGAVPDAGAMFALAHILQAPDADSAPLSEARLAVMLRAIGIYQPPRRVYRRRGPIAMPPIQQRPAVNPVKAARLRHGLTQREMAAHLGVSEVSVKSWERRGTTPAEELPRRILEGM